MIEDLSCTFKWDNGDTVDVVYPTINRGINTPDRGRPTRVSICGKVDTTTTKQEWVYKYIAHTMHPTKWDGKYD